MKQHALYPKQIDDNCPYCGSDNVHNDMDEFAPSVDDVSIKVNCEDCGKSHFLNYRLETISLVDKKDDYTDYYVGFELPDVIGDAKPIVVGVNFSSDGLFVMAVDHVDGSSNRGYGVPIIVENYYGNLRAAIYNDANKDEVGPIVSLKNAKYEKQEIDSEFPFVVRVLTLDEVVIEESIHETFDEAKMYAKENAVVPYKHRLKVVDLRTNEELPWKD